MLVDDESSAIPFELELDVTSRVDTKSAANLEWDRHLTFLGDPHQVRLPGNTGRRDSPRDRTAACVRVGEVRLGDGICLRRYFV